MSADVSRQKTKCVFLCVCVCVCVCKQVLELIQRLQTTSQPASDDATSIKSAASNADSGRGASDEGDARQRLLRAAGAANNSHGTYVINSTCTFFRRLYGLSRRSRRVIMPRP